MLRSNCKYQCSSEKGKCQEHFQPCMHTALANHASSGQTGWVCGWVAMSGQGAWTAACTNKKRGELAVQEGREAAQGCLLVHAGSCCWDRPYRSDSFWLQHMEEVPVQWADRAGCRLEAVTGQTGVWHGEWHSKRSRRNAFVQRSRLPNCTFAPN